MASKRPLILRGDHERRRFFVGVAVDERVQQITVALVAAIGRGYDARFEIGSHVTSALPASIGELWASLAREPNAAAADLAWLSWQLAEAQAAALAQLAEAEPDVFPHTLAAGAIDPGWWNRAKTTVTYTSLTDGVRLAELSGLNVIDAFPARDLAQEGAGAPLHPVPLWLLLHDPHVPRLVVELEPTLRLTYLPPSRDESGIARLKTALVADRSQFLAGCQACLPTDVRGVEYLFVGSRQEAEDTPLAEYPLERVLTEAEHALAPGAVEALSAALLAFCHCEQIPASTTRLTGCRHPRVLGRLTPGTPIAWNLFLREASFSRPITQPLRRAI